MILPLALKVGDTLGVFTPSSPSYVDNEKLFTNGLRNLEKLGFSIKLGALTAKRTTQGHRSGSPQERAQEFMQLIADDSVHGLISTIGGSNSSSLIPFLDFDLISKKRKLMCGYSDVTSLHLAINKFANLSTIYGPSVMCWFGDWPDGITESATWFMEAVSTHRSGPRRITAPLRWSNHRRRWDNGDWQTMDRVWQPNPGWQTLREGVVQAPFLAYNLSTLMSAAGTGYWPDFTGKILLIEEMDAPIAEEERHLTQLKLMGVFEEIVGLIYSKPENHNPADSTVTLGDIILETVGQRDIPIVSNFDCGHTVPMISIPQNVPVALVATREAPVELTLLGPGIEL